MDRILSIIRWVPLCILISGYGCAIFQSNDGPNGLEVSPEQFRAQVLQGIRQANAKLVKSGYAALPEDSDLAVEIRTDGTLREGHKKIFIYNLWVGGCARKDGWFVVEDVKPAATIGRNEHEASHVLLWQAGIHDTKHHEIMRKAGIYGT
ncbi:MAG: hypothetical protein V2A34_02505 [Lentisphaerota bacterium]